MATRPEANLHLVKHKQDALQAYIAGETDVAERLVLDLLEISPGCIDALSTLYKIRKAQGNQPATESLITRIVTMFPDNFWAINEITLHYLEKRALRQADRYARKAIRIAPAEAQSHFLMAMVLTEANRPAAGEFHYYRALELSGFRAPMLLANLALCLNKQGKTQAARALYLEVIASSPNCLQALLGWARLEEADRNFATAMELLDRAEVLSPSNPDVMLTRAIVIQRMGDVVTAVHILDELADNTAGSDAAGCLERGRLLDKMGRYSEAFDAYVDGKFRLRERSGNAYLAEHAQNLSARLKSFFRDPRARILPRAAVRGDMAQPLFILGFPRSGTTLLEQTLTMHRHISAGDELNIIADLSNMIPHVLDSRWAYPEALAELWIADHRDDLDTLRDIYLRRAAQRCIVEEQSIWFTDKTPLNEMHLGLIALLFPQSPLIHLIRHPLDVMLSVFSNHLTHGYYCAYSLESSARHYVLIMDLLEHYRRELSPRYHSVRYEDIVTNQEATIRGVLDFIGENFDSRCLAFHENLRRARTPSYVQVSEQLYDRSRFRYRHYLPQLEPIIPILQSTIDRLGYSI